MLYGTMPRPVTITFRVGIITLNGVDSLMRTVIFRQVQVYLGTICMRIVIITL